MSERSALILALACDACVIERQAQPFRTTEHHQNFSGYAGKPRLGHAYSVPLCEWHHVGKLKPGLSSTQMDELYGPSLKYTSRRFRAVYGKDQVMLERTNRRLGIAESTPAHQPVANHSTKDMT